MEEQGLLIGEQFKHMMDVMDAKLDRIELNQLHLKEMIEHRLYQLEEQGKDNEARIRTATEGVIKFNVRSGPTSEGSEIMSIMAILKSFLGG